MIEHDAVRRCEDLFERSESRSTMRGIVILSDSERATWSLLVASLCRNREKNLNVIVNVIVIVKYVAIAKETGIKGGD